MSKIRNNHWWAILALPLALALVFAACGLGPDERPQQVRLVSAAAPAIITQPPATATVVLEAEITVTPPLTIVAESPDDGALSYQWFSYAENVQYMSATGTAIEGATSATFVPASLEEGVYNLYVIVTNTIITTATPTATAKSAPVLVTVRDPNNAFFPNITQQPLDTAVDGTDATLSVAATTGDTGTLSYQWYKTDTLTATGGTAAGTGATLMLTNVVGDPAYYYVVVTNTRNEASGRKESPVTSNPVAVRTLTANATFTVDTGTKYQYVRGFGGMYTPWDNIPQDRLSDYETMFNPDTGLGLNILRIMIMATYADIDRTMDELTKNIMFPSRDRSFYYDIVNTVNNYDGYVLASPWSPPAVWKTNGSVNGGGDLREPNYRHFADYLRKFCQHMYDKGAPIYAVSMQNEPTFTATYEGCEYTTEQHRNWWRVAQFFTEGVQGWGGGKSIPRVLTMTGESHNAVAPFHTEGPVGPNAISALQNEETRPYIDIVGRHIYGAGNNFLAAPFTPPQRDNTDERHGKEVWMTEHNINSGAGLYPQDSTWNYVWKFMNDVDLTIRLNYENAFIWWTAVRFYSFIGDGTESTTAGAILPRGLGVSHYAKFAKEMTRVKVDATGQDGAGVTINNNTVNRSIFDIDSTDVKVTAYESEDGNTISLVMYTPTNPSGQGGTNMGTVKIQLPAGFTVGSATAMRSSATGAIARTESENVLISADKNSAFVELPVSQMLSVRFIKAAN